LFLSLLPISLGIVMSPLAILAVVAVLFSHEPRRNSVAFLAGWIVGSALSLTLTYALLTALQVHGRREPPLWVPILHLLVGAVLLGGAWFVQQRGRAHLHSMSQAHKPRDIVGAAPQLPRVLQAVEHFTAPRSALLGFALFTLNPVDVSCAVAAAMDVRLSTTPPAGQVLAAIIFVLVGASSVIAPVAMLFIRQERAAAPLSALRTWVAGNTKLLNVGVLLLIAVMQISKGVQGL